MFKNIVFGAIAVVLLLSMVGLAAGNLGGNNNDYEGFVENEKSLQDLTAEGGNEDLETETDNIKVDKTEVETVEEGESVKAVAKIPESKYYASYILDSDEYGTSTVSTVKGETRTIVTNALPNHETGEFPREGNPNTISAQDNTYSITTQPVFIGEPVSAREPGVAINGVKFEPETAERTTCESAEVYSIEAFQDWIDLGLDFNNAHVQPTGAYHYHGVSGELVEFADGAESDLVHVGFAKDGHMMYYSKSGQFTPSYMVSTEARVGTNCTTAIPGPGNVSEVAEIEGSTPDGRYVSDWEYIDGSGELDECNGVEIEDEYSYLITDQYPYIPRCLMGEFTESRPGGVGAPPGR